MMAPQARPRGVRSQGRLLVLLGGLSCLAPALAAAPARPAAPAATADGGHGLVAELFDDEKFEHKVKQRVDRAIDFFFGNGSPDEEMRADRFSIRWTGWIRTPRPVSCKLVAYADDTVSVWLDGKPVIKDAHGRTEAIVDLTGKPQALRVEYVEETSTAHVSLHWVLPGKREEETVVPADVLFRDAAVAAKAKDRPPRPAKGTGMLAEIFEGEKFEKKVAERVDEQLDHYWGDGTIHPGVRPNNFSARWSAWLKAPRPGRYKLIFFYDDGVRATLDRKPIIDEWKGGHHKAEAFVDFSDKALPLVVEYREESAGAYLSMHWEQDGGFKEQIIPAAAFFTDKAATDRPRPAAAR
jgi:hypothetical protein